MMVSKRRSDTLELQTRYYTRNDITAAGIPPATLDLWAKRFKGKRPLGVPLVVKLKGKHIHYSQDVLAFLQERRHKTGPGNLPDPERIALLFVAMRAGKTLDEIVALTGDNPVVVQVQLETLGLEVSNAPTTEKA